MAEPQTDAAWQPKILAFLCNWCSYAGADLAGTSRLQYPPNVRVIRVPCSGRVNPIYIVAALRQGADGVLVSGCHPGDCHYLAGNYFARRRFAMLQRYLEYLGIEEGRVQFSWVSASEASRFAEVVTKVTEDVRRLGPNRRLRIQMAPAPTLEAEER
ncbi:MAG: hydrogenase iron-sulfur subunit [Chloroflexi bacterium]|jgi:F420-non-reducing hydrogenase iron-sulfur subunit|nr:hydrogenase iron-sulfur subunit [Chloroflexota bacterium]